LPRCERDVHGQRVAAFPAMNRCARRADWSSWLLGFASSPATYLSRGSHTSGAGSTMGSMSTSAPRWRRSASCWAAGSSSPAAEEVGAAGANPGGARFQYAPDAESPRADGTYLRHRSRPGLVRQTVVGRHFRWHQQRPPGMITMWDEHTTRKPRLSLRLSGLLLLR
jgi:hypothetical protein